MKMKTADLIGRALDWAVADLEFKRMIANGEHVKDWVLDEHRIGMNTDPYSIDWLWGGPIIERERIHLCPIVYNDLSQWHAWPYFLPRQWGIAIVGPTALVVAMRAYVASKLGEEVEVPDCLG